MLQFWTSTGPELVGTGTGPEKRVIKLKRHVYCFDTLYTIKSVLSDHLKKPYSEIALFVNEMYIGLKIGELSYYTQEDKVDKGIDKNIDKSVANTTDILMFDSITPIYLLTDNTGECDDVLSIEVACLKDVNVEIGSIRQRTFWPTYDASNTLHPPHSFPPTNTQLSPQYVKYFEELDGFILLKTKMHSNLSNIREQTTLKSMTISMTPVQVEHNLGGVQQFKLREEDVEKLYQDIILTQHCPTVTLTLKPLKRTLYGVYVGKDTPLRIQDLKRFIFESKHEPYKTDGILITMYPSSNIIEVLPNRITFRIRNPIILETREIGKSIDTTLQSEWDMFMSKGPTQVTSLMSSGMFNEFTQKKISKISLSWKLSVPIGNLLSIIGHPLIKVLFKRTSKNDYTNHYSQNIYQFQYDPIFQRKLNTKGVHGLPRIQCSIRNTSNNVLTVFITAESKTKMYYHIKFIEFILDVWKTVVLNTIRLSPIKTISESGYSFTSLKDGNPSLFRDSARKGGYSRKSQNHRDDRLKDNKGVSRQRYRQPVIIDWNNPEDQKMYYGLKHQSWVLESMGVFYAAIRDEIENGEAIESYNDSNPNNKIDYFNKLVMFEIYEESYLADDAELGLLWPVCQQSKTKLSRRHLDAMRPAYQNGTLKIHGVDADILKKELENPQYIMDNEVGYIMKTSRTLPINGYGHLPQDKSGLFEWFRQHTLNFKNNTCEYLRKGTIHDDPYNIFHAVVDALNIGRYQTKSFEEKCKETVTFVERCVSELTIRMFRVLENGTLATKISFTDFIQELKNPQDKILHTTVLELLCRFTKTNIVIFDNDVKPDSVETYWPSTFGTYERTIMLLKMRNNYETIVYFSDNFKTDDQPKVPTSTFDSTNEIVILISDQVTKSIKLKNQQIYFTRQIVQQIGRLIAKDVKATMIGQCINAQNQTDYILTNLLNVPIPLPFKHPPFDNAVILPVNIFECELTFREFSALSKSPNLTLYTPHCWIKENQHIVALQLKGVNGGESGGLFVNVIPRLAVDQELYCLPIVDNYTLKNPHYPNLDDAIELGIKEDDERTLFILSLVEVRKCITAIKNLLVLKAQHYVKLFDDWYFNINTRRTKQDFRKLISNWLKNILLDDSLLIEQTTIKKYFIEIHFVLVAYFYRNPCFFQQHLNNPHRIHTNPTNPTNTENAIITNTRRFTSTNHILEWIQKTSDSSFIGTKARLQHHISSVSYPPIKGPILKLRDLKGTLTNFGLSDHFFPKMDPTLIIKKYLDDRFPSTNNDAKIIKMLQLCVAKVSMFPDYRILDEGLTFGDVRRCEDSEVVLCGLGMYFLLGRRIDIHIQRSDYVLIVGYDGDEESLKINV